MARHALQQIGNSDRHRFIGTFVRYGTKRGWEGAIEETVLLKNIRLADGGRQVADHLWLNRTGGWDDCELPEGQTDFQGGEQVEFTARVAEYEKGYQGRRAEENGEAWSGRDWKLERPTKFRVLMPDEKKQATLQEKKA